MNRRIKLNDRVTFPLYLDLNQFTDEGKSKSPTKTNEKENKTVHKVEEEEEADLTPDEDEEEGGAAPSYKDKKAFHPHNADHDGAAYGGESQYRNKMNSDYENNDPDFNAPYPNVTPDAPYVYELFSVMIHRGSSMGGHYYAYIKSFVDKKWYEFNDSMVSEITVNDVKKAFGGDEEGGGGFSSAFSRSYSFRSNANAYMLMYRKIDKERNASPMTGSEIPAEVKRVIEEETSASKQKKKEEELEREMIKFKIFYAGEEKPLNMHKSATLFETTKSAVNLFGVTAPISCCRLRGYSQYNDIPGETYSGKEHKNLDDLHFLYSNKNLLLEVKNEGEEFDEYDPSKILFKVSKYDPETQTFSKQSNLYVSKLGNFGDLRLAIEKKFGVPHNKQNLYKESQYYHNTAATFLLKSENVPLHHLHFSEPEKLIVEFTDNPITQEDDFDEKQSPIILALEKN